jgi:cytolysin-activating lysine-acyltransferase
MRHKNLIITAPSVTESDCSEAEIFGCVVWLWMNSKSQSDMPLSALSLWLLPALKLKQFVLAYEMDGQHTRPVAYMAWAQLSAETESRYVNNSALSLSPEEWRSGDRFWITDFFTPYGHAKPFADAIATTLSDFCFRSLYHRGADRGMRVLYFRGDHVPLQQAKRWWKDRPILARRATQLKDEVNRTSS